MTALTKICLQNFPNRLKNIQATLAAITRQQLPVAVAVVVVLLLFQLFQLNDHWNLKLELR